MLKNINLICDKNYRDAKKIIEVNRIKKDVVYSNPIVGLNVLLKLNNKVKYLSQNMSNEIKELNKNLNN